MTNPDFVQDLGRVLYDLRRVFEARGLKAPAVMTLEDEAQGCRLEAEIHRSLSYSRKVLPLERRIHSLKLVGIEITWPGRAPAVGGWDERALAAEILAELVRARAKFPGKNVTFAALVEEVGELATATFSEPRDNVRKEAVQVAVMAMRMVLDGDHTFDAWRDERDLDPLFSVVAPSGKAP